MSRVTFQDVLKQFMLSLNKCLSWGNCATSCNVHACLLVWVSIHISILEKNEEILPSGFFFYIPQCPHAPPCSISNLYSTHAHMSQNNMHQAMVQTTAFDSNTSQERIWNCLVPYVTQTYDPCSYELEQHASNYRTEPNSKLYCKKWRISEPQIGITHSSASIHTYIRLQPPLVFNKKKRKVYTKY